MTPANPKRGLARKVEVGEGRGKALADFIEL